MTESNTQTVSPWLGLAEAVEVLGVHESTVRRWADRGAIKTIRTPGNQRRFSREDCERIARDGYVDTEAGSASSRVALVLAGTAVFGTLLGVATARPLLVLALLASVLIVGAVGVLVAAVIAVMPEVLGALYDEARTRHRAGMARLRDDAIRRHPAGSAR